MDEADNAARYALRELNGFPQWFEKLATSYPEVVRSVLSTQIKGEFAAEPDAPDPGHVLSSVLHGPDEVRRLCAGHIIEQLAEQDPLRSKALDDALNIVVQTDNIDRSQLIEISALRVDIHASSGNEESLLSWLAAWLSIDGAGAWKFVERYLAEKDEKPSQLVVGLAGTLGDRSWGGQGIENLDFLRPEVVERMIRVTYEHVRPEDDLVHDGVYSPGTRDNAQHFRGWLPQYLAQIPGKEAQEVLRRLANDFEPANIRRWFRRLAEQQAAGEIEYPPWSPSDIADFGAIHERAPTSAHELFQIALDRLNDIKEDIECGEFSDRGLFQPGMPEHLIQHWLAGRLEREKPVADLALFEKKKSVASRNPIFASITRTLVW